MRDLPPVFWTLAHVHSTRPSRRGPPHLFAADVDGSACRPDRVPIVTGREPGRRRLPRLPPQQACKSCLRAWRAGWPAHKETHP